MAARVRVNLFPNGVTTGGKVLVLMQDAPFDDVLAKASQKLGTPVKRLFEKNGGEISGADEIMADDVLYASGGEDFVVPGTRAPAAVVAAITAADAKAAADRAKREAADAEVAARLQRQIENEIRTAGGEGPKPAHESGATVMCPVCCDEKSYAETFFINGCTDSFCHGCMAEYVQGRILGNDLVNEERKIVEKDDQGRTVGIRYEKTAGIPCPGMGCTNLIEYNAIKRLVDADVLGKFAQFSFNKVLTKIPGVDWCPKAGCGSAVIADADMEMLQCLNPECYFKYCKKCREDAHEGATCEEIAELRAELEREKAEIEAEMRFYAENPGREYGAQVEGEAWHRKTATPEGIAKGVAETMKTSNMLGNLIKHGQVKVCDACGALYMKEDGCNWVQCGNCGEGLCWYTGQLRSKCGGGHNCH